MKCEGCPVAGRCLGDQPNADRLCVLIRTDPAYRALAEGLPPPVVAAAPIAEVSAGSGPGDWLAWGLHRVGFREASDCSCAADAAEMNAIGPDAVLADLEAWTDRLAAKPQAAHVPGRAIRLAIRLACHAAKRSAR